MDAHEYICFFPNLNILCIFWSGFNLFHIFWVDWFDDQSGTDNTSFNKMV